MINQKVLNILALLLLFALIVNHCSALEDSPKIQNLYKYIIPTNESDGCVTFSPYVNGLSPDVPQNGIPSRELIDRLLDELVQKTKFKCILIFGGSYGYGKVIASARERNLKIVMNVWLDKYPNQNDGAIEQAIPFAKNNEDVVIGVSCGSELRLREGASFAETEIRKCLTRMREENVQQPLTYQGLWFNWCNEAYNPCGRWNLVNDVDYVSVNIYAYWEAKFSGFFQGENCPSAEKTDTFHLNLYNDIKSTYSNKPVILSEWGYPGGDAPNTKCVITNDEKQRLALSITLQKFKEEQVPSILFSSFRNPYKSNTDEGNVGEYWGFCSGSPPYECYNYPSNWRGDEDDGNDGDDGNGDNDGDDNGDTGGDTGGDDSGNNGNSTNICDDQVIGKVTYDKNIYVCADGKRLCPKGNGQCNLNCYQCDLYKCCSNGICQKGTNDPSATTSDTCASDSDGDDSGDDNGGDDNNGDDNGDDDSGDDNTPNICNDSVIGSVSYNPDQYECANDPESNTNRLCPKGNGNCNKNCYDKNNYKCCNGKICFKGHCDC